MLRLTLWITATVAVMILLFSYRTSLGATVAAPPAAIVMTPAGPEPLGSGPPADTRTIDGPVIRTRYGPVQVEVRLQDRTIVDVRALHWPDADDRDAEISAAALPRLRSAVLAAQSANVDTVSGATYTSDGYRRSLQGALDQAHVG
ncbi:FMN-binding protein [Dactylosporangium vinaceum]|uniref:FMN-binding protein n=1 Tax=Dactylosporangium vinaceum TaxID=53362 RepID=A0ABV5M9H0_9ACTN|nr:FMN-binding protein [Dactylosporangium vinaceum]UAB99996.1 FMN-binding protein [Dactylosporangium vinaceum]